MQVLNTQTNSQDIVESLKGQIGLFQRKLEERNLKLIDAQKTIE